MDGNGHLLSLGARSSNISNNNLMYSGIPLTDDTEADVLNDETFGDCDLETIKMKSDFGENGEFLGENSSGNLPDFFDTDTNDGLSSMNNNDDQSQSIDALLGEDPMRISIRQASTNPLFNMAISQARDGNIFTQPAPPPPIQRLSSPAPPPSSLPPQQQLINYQLLKQFEQSLISRQVPPQERMILLQAMFEKIQRDTMHIQQQTARMANLNLNGHNIYNQRQQQQQQPMPIGEMMERARLTAMNTNNSRSQSPSVGISSQFMDAIQRSDQIPNQSSPPPPPPPPHPVDTNVPHHGQSRQNRSTRHYPRPPMLNTWQGRGPNHDEFAGLMSDREKQWVVKIQLHQVSQTQEEDYYFHKWSQQKHASTQLNRHDYRGQKISYPVLQLLKSIQQEKELADRLSQSSAQAAFSNVNPLPYALPIQTQLGKQSIATPRHPRCTLHLDGQFSLGTQAQAITHDKYTLGLLLHIENLRRDILQLDENHEELPREFQSIIDRYLNDKKYFFPDIFGQFSKGRIIYERLHRYLIKSNMGHLELMLIHLYGSLSYIIQRWSTTFHIEPIVMNTISLMQQQINVKKTTFEQLLNQIYTYYKDEIRTKLDSHRSFESPFSNPALFTHSHIVTILIEFLLILERQCYLLSGANTSNLPIHIMQQFQPQLQYQLSEYVRLFVNDLSQALIHCSSVKKILKPFAQIQQQQFALLCKFLRIQLSPEIYSLLEPKLIQCCIKDSS